MVNPCNECIVRAMCENPCDELIQEIRIKINDFHGINPKYIAKQLRTGGYKISDDMIWRVIDGEPMYRIFN